MAEPRYDVDLIRRGALQMIELETAVRDIPRHEVEQFLELQLDTLGPLDTAELKVLRRGNGPWRAAPGA